MRTLGQVRNLVHDYHLSRRPLRPERFQLLSLSRKDMDVAPVFL